MLEGFYEEINKLLTKDLDWKTGYKLDAYILYLVVFLSTQTWSTTRNALD